MTQRCRMLGCLVMTAFVVVCGVRAGEMKKELDCAANVKLLDDNFQRYYAPARAIHRDPKGIRFFFAAGSKDTNQTGLASTFAIAGDFEITADYVWTPVAVPTKGYGVRCGIAVESGDLIVMLARGNLTAMGSAYVVTVGRKKAGEERKFNDEATLATKAKAGKLLLRRVKSEVVCLVAEGAAEANELCRVPFTLGTAQKVLIFADPGKTSAALDARVINIKVRAEEITSKLIARRDEGSSLLWWLAGSALIGVAAIMFWAYRRRHNDPAAR